MDEDEDMRWHMEHPYPVSHMDLNWKEYTWLTRRSGSLALVQSRVAEATRRVLFSLIQDGKISETSLTILRAQIATLKGELDALLLAIEAHQAE